MDELVLVIVKPWKWRNENCVREDCDVDEKLEQSQKRLKKKKKEDAISLSKLLQDHVILFIHVSISRIIW